MDLTFLDRTWSVPTGLDPSQLYSTCPKLTSQDLTWPVLTWPVLNWPILTWPVLTSSVLPWPVLNCPFLTCHPTYHSNIPQIPSRHLPETLKKPSRQPPDTTRHPPDNIQTPSRYYPNPFYRVFLGNCQNHYAYERALKYKMGAGTGVFISLR